MCAGPYGQGNEQSSKAGGVCDARGGCAPADTVELPGAHRAAQRASRSRASQRETARAFLKIVVALPNNVATARGVLEKGIHIPGVPGGPLMLPTFESNVLFILRFMVDCNVGLPAACHRMRSRARADHGRQLAGTARRGLEGAPEPRLHLSGASSCAYAGQQSLTRAVAGGGCAVRAVGEPPS